MKRVAVFGNAGGGTSTLARRLAVLTGLPLYPLDLIEFRPGGGAVPHEDYPQAHAELLQREAWIIVDLPLFTHFRWVTKRLVKGIFVTPEGWPTGSPMIASTLNSYRVLWSCHRHLTPEYRRLVVEARPRKRVHHLRSVADMDAFLNAVRQAHG